MSTSNQPTLKDSLNDIIELRPFPAAASQLMVACEKKDVAAREITSIIKHDPGLSIKLLQIANSPLYGFAGEIRSVDHATVVLGMRALRDLAISTAVGGVFGTGEHTTAIARKQLWMHSLACGSIARTLAKTIGMQSPDEAFLGGIVHDVGKLFFYDFQPETYSKLDSNSQSSNCVAAEVDAFGIAHTQVGHKCGQNWGLPDEINDLICFHHEPEAADFGGDLIDTVSAANRLCHLWIASNEDTTAASSDILNAIKLDFSPDEIMEFQTLALADVGAICEAYIR
jgi:putative nucleotidyltransferase with HDIG domain